MIKVLVTEDDVLVREVLSRFLHKMGFDTLHAGTGCEAINLAVTHHPAIILMDIGLPCLTGLEATRQLKMLPETRNIPIIALTAYNTAEDRKKSFEAGCDAFETKPLAFDRLLRTINKLLETYVFTPELAERCHS